MQLHFASYRYIFKFVEIIKIDFNFTLESVSFWLFLRNTAGVKQVLTDYRITDGVKRIRINIP